MPVRFARGRRLLFPLFLILATLVAYAPAFRAGFIWDDDFYVTENDTLLDPTPARIWLDPSANPQYYPLTFTTFWLERRIFGLDPTGYHALNVLLHAASALLLWRILLRLGIPGARLAAALFALHPLQVESVAWVTERKNVLSGFFFFSAALVYVRFSLAAKKRPLLVLAACGLFACALLSKSVTAFLPIGLALSIFWKKGRLTRAELSSLGFMLLLGAASGLVTARLERLQVGAEGGDWSRSPLEHVLLAGRIFWFYLGKIVLPLRLAFQYPRFVIDSGSPASYAFPAAALATGAALVGLRARIGNGPLVALAYYTAGIFPVLGFLNVFPMRYSWVADHFSYLAVVGPLVLLAALATIGGRRLRAIPARVAAVLVLVGLTLLTSAHARSFHDAETLWHDTVVRYPDAWMAQYNLACLLDEQGKSEEAVDHLLRALQTNPEYVDALNNLGSIRLAQGRVEEAAACFEKIVKLAPDHVTARYNLALTLDRSGQTDRAIHELREVLRATPDPSSLRGGMGAVLYRRGWLGVPLERTHAVLGALLARIGRNDEATAEYLEVARLRPDLPDPWLSLGRLDLDLGKLEEAVSCFERAVAIDASNARAASLLAEARARAQRARAGTP